METNGKGKYDDALTVAQEMVGATQGLLLIIDGDEGSGLSTLMKPELIDELPNTRNFAHSRRG